MGSFSDPGVDLPPNRVAELAGAGAVELIDVREAHEREAGHVARSRHIELGRLASEADSLPRDRPIVFLCRVGARSAMAAQTFRAAGYDARNLEGGMQAWVEARLPIVPTDGYVADH